MRGRTAGKGELDRNRLVVGTSVEFVRLSVNQVKNDLLLQFCVILF